MRYGVLILALFIVGAPVPKQKHRPAPPMPDHFVIARHSFWDNGPPLDAYELFIVRPTPSGSSVEKVTLIPQGIACIVPAKVEESTASIGESPAALLGSTNPCTIPENELTREIKRCKNCVVFSGASVTMQVQCADQIRVIRSRILDQDMFAPTPNTPEHTSWTMQLLQHLDGAFGSSAIDQPIFPSLENEEPRQKKLDSATLREVRDGKYDALFQDAPDKVSDLYLAAQTVPSPPIAHLIGALAVTPQVFSQPVYPMLAQMARVEGEVTFDFDIDPGGIPTNLRNDVGPVMLKGAVVSAIKSWKFPKDASGHEIKATFEFILTCKPSEHH